MKKLAPVCAAAFLIFYLANTPTDAARVLNSTIDLLGSVAHGLSRFVTDAA